MRKNTQALATALSLATALALSGCAVGMNGMDMGEDSSSTPSPESTFNEADTMFAQMMIPHHEQAIEMSDLLLATAGVDEQVRALALTIKDAQQPEIDQLTQWLEDWGVETTNDHGMDMGTMSDEDMTALDNATGVDASRLFLEQMIVHHEGAVEMAQTQVDSGSNPQAIAMAQSIVTSQTAEIALMQKLLTTL